MNHQDFMRQLAICHSIIYISYEVDVFQTDKSGLLPHCYGSVPILKFDEKRSGTDLSHQNFPFRFANILTRKTFGERKLAQIRSNKS